MNESGKPGKRAAVSLGYRLNRWHQTICRVLVVEQKQSSKCPFTRTEQIYQRDDSRRIRVASSVFLLSICPLQRSRAYIAM